MKDEDLAAVRDLARRFADKELADPSSRDRYPFIGFSRDVVAKAASIGFLNLTRPESLGGAGLGMAALAEVVEAVAVRDASLSLIILAQCLARDFLTAHADEGTVRRWVSSPPGPESLIALPLYDDPEEPPAGIAAAPDGDGWLLEGSMEYVAGLPVAGAVLVPAVQNDRVQWFLVETSESGVGVGDPVVSLGLRAFPAADLRLDGARVPGSHRMRGEAAGGFAELAERYRGPLTAVAVGILKGCLETAKNYAAERYQAKKQIIEHDMVRRMLAEMAAWIDLGSAAVDLVCGLTDRGEKGLGSRLLSIHELVTRAAARAATDGVQVLGGYGYMRGFGQEKRMRDAKQLQAVFGGSNERTLRILERRLTQ